MSTLPAATATALELRDFHPSLTDVLNGSERLGNHGARVVGKHAHVWKALAQRGDVGAVKQRAGVAFARIAKGIKRAPVKNRQRHLQRMGDPMFFSDILDEADHSLDAGDRIVLQSERQRQVEHDFRIRAARDFGKQIGGNREHEIALDPLELADGAVVLEHPVFVTERMAIGALDRRSGCCAHVGHEHGRLDLRGQIEQVLVAPGGLHPLVEAGRAPVPYHPTPNPSPFVVVAPERAARLWSISECLGLKSSSSR